MPARSVAVEVCTQSAPRSLIRRAFLKSRCYPPPALGDSVSKSLSLSRPARAPPRRQRGCRARHIPIAASACRSQTCRFPPRQSRRELGFVASRPSRCFGAGSRSPRRKHAPPPPRARRASPPRKFDADPRDFVSRDPQPSSSSSSRRMQDGARSSSRVGIVYSLGS